MNSTREVYSDPAWNTVPGRPNARKNRVWVVTPRIYAQQVQVGNAREWQCFTDSEPPNFQQNYVVVRGSDARQIDVEENENGYDPNIASKLRPGERFNNRDLQNKYVFEMVPLARPNQADCRRLLNR